MMYCYFLGKCLAPWLSLKYSIFPWLHTCPLTDTMVLPRRFVTVPWFQCKQLISEKLHHHKEHPAKHAIILIVITIAFFKLIYWKTLHFFFYLFKTQSLITSEHSMCFTFALALLKKTPRENRPSVTPPIRPFKVSVAWRIPPSCSTTNTNKNDNIPYLYKMTTKLTG